MVRGSADVMTSAGEVAACAYPPTVLSAYLLKVFCKWPIQKGHFVKIWAGRFMDPLFEIEMERKKSATSCEW